MTRAGLIALAFAATVAAAPAGAQTAGDASAGTPGRIRVDFATYGAACGEKEENATATLRLLCDGQVRCEIALGAAVLGDPAPACDEDLTVQWSCSGTLPGRNRIQVIPEAGGATLACAAASAPAADGATAETEPAEAPPPEPVAADAPPGAARIRVDAATYGGNCGAPPGNATRPLAEACDGRDACSYIVDRNILGDPAPACAKDLIVQWSCPGEAAGFRATAVPPEAGLGSIVALACPVTAAAPAAAATPAPARPCDGSFNGTWATSLGPIDLAEDGEAVTGSYPGGGSIEGTRRDDGTLEGRWRDASGAGTLRFTLAADGRRFDGSWSRDGGGGGAWHGSCVTPPATATAVAEGPLHGFAWVGTDADYVGEADQALPDGEADGHFRLDLDLGYPAQEIRSIALRSSDAGGGPFGDAAWDTGDPQHAILGVVFNGAPLQKTHAPSLGGFQGAFALDLYAGDPGRLEPGQHVAAEVTMGDGRVFRRLAQIPPAATTTAAGSDAGAPLEQDTDRPGGDFGDFAMPQAEPMLCRAACLAAPGCRAWTYVKPGLSGAQAHCWLKASVPEPKANGCCVSGVAKSP